MSVILFGSLLAVLTACGNGNATSSSIAVDTAATSIPFTNGITDKNKGSISGNVRIHGSAASLNGKRMVLYSTYGRINQAIDSVAIQNGTFDFGEKKLDNGIYMLGPSENNVSSILISAKESDLNFNISSMRMDVGVQCANSPENDAWLKYLPKEALALKQIKDLRIAAAKSPMKAEMEKQVVAKEAEFAKYQGEMIAANPNTFFSKVLTWKQEPNRTDIQQYWSNIDFSDASLIHGTVLSERIQNFMRGFSKGQESGFIECIGIVAEKARTDDTVLEFVLNQMLVGFYESGMENISTYIIDNYIHGDACGDADLSNIIKSTAESIQKLSIGATPPNIQLDALGGGKIDLMNMVKQKKYTLVMFWSSWCEHCKGEAPEVKQAYDQWKAKGFEIVGVSVDTQVSAWEAAVKDRGFVFPNGCGKKLWDSKAAKDYRVTRTPAFFLVDNGGKIVLKPKSIREVNAYLMQHLK